MINRDLIIPMIEGGTTWTTTEDLTPLVNKLKVGDIIHCRNNRILSRIIRWATKSYWSHTAIFIDVWGQPCVLEAQKNGVNLKTWDSWVKEYGYEWSAYRKPTLGNPDAFAKHALSKAGVTGYDFNSLIIRSPWKIITGSFRKMKKNEEERMFCSEYVAWCHGIKDSYQMTPDDVAHFCDYSKWHKIV